MYYATAESLNVEDGSRSDTHLRLVEPIDDSKVEKSGNNESYNQMLSGRTILDYLMKDAERHPVLSKQEEHELAYKYRETGDWHYAQMIVAANTRFAVKLANQNRGYINSKMQIEDIVGQACIGMCIAVKKFDPDRGVKFISFAVRQMQSQINDYAMRNKKSFPVGTTKLQRATFYNNEKLHDILVDGKGTLEDAKKVLKEAGKGAKREALENALIAVRGNDLYLDQSVEYCGVEGNAIPKDLLSDGRMDPEKSFANRQWAEYSQDLVIIAISDMMREIDKEGTYKAFDLVLAKRLLRDKDGDTEDDKRYTLQKIGEELGVSRERARQREKEVMITLERYLNELMQPMDYDVLAGR